jgi:hypothetical protein
MLALIFARLSYHVWYVQAIAALLNATALQSLCLSFNLMKADVIPHFITAVTTSSTCSIHTLDMACNIFDDSALQPLT